MVANLLTVRPAVSVGSGRDEGIRQALRDEGVDPNTVSRGSTSNPPGTPASSFGPGTPSRKASQLARDSWTATIVQPPSDGPPAWKIWPAGRLSSDGCTAASEAAYCSRVPPMDAWLLLLRTHTRLWERIESHMRREHGITVARFDVLTQLDLAGGRLGLSDLAAALLLSPSGLSKLLDRMDASGLIVREPDPDDARASFASLTPRGRRLVTRARSSHHDLVRQLFGEPLSNRDVADLVRVLSRIQATLDAGTS